MKRNTRRLVECVGLNRKLKIVRKQIMKCACLGAETAVELACRNSE